MIFEKKKVLACLGFGPSNCRLADIHTHLTRAKGLSRSRFSRSRPIMWLRIRNSRYALAEGPGQFWMTLMAHWYRMWRVNMLFDRLWYICSTKEMRQSSSLPPEEMKVGFPPICMWMAPATSIHLEPVDRFTWFLASSKYRRKRDLASCSCF